MATPETERVQLGISACLLGRPVRFDGGHKRDGLLTDTLSRWVKWVEVCPELEIGLGVPRPTLRLVGDEASPRLVFQKSGEDITDRMVAFSRQRLPDFEALDGFVLKRDSPSCGFERVRVYAEAGAPSKKGQGIFAAALTRRFPLMPVEDDGRLNDPGLRENFIERVFAHRRLRALLSNAPKVRDVVEFHAHHKLTLSAHHPPTYRALGKLVANAERRSPPALAQAYAAGFMEAMKRVATRRQHADVLYHLMGHLKRALGAEDKQELVGLIEDYRKGTVPLIVPITMFKHHFRNHPSEWVAQQTYLAPYPAELMLRNHV